MKMRDVSKMLLENGFQVGIKLQMVEVLHISKVDFKLVVKEQVFEIRG